MTTIEKYTQQLTFALRLRDVPGEVIGDAIAQVESHVADTGEGPREEFGPAREYAATFGERKLPARRWVWFALNALTGFPFACILLMSLFAQLRGEQLPWGIAPAVAIAVGSVTPFFATTSHTPPDTDSFLSSHARHAVTCGTTNCSFAATISAFFAAGAFCFPLSLVIVAIRREPMCVTSVAREE